VSEEDRVVLCEVGRFVLDHSSSLSRCHSKGWIVLSWRCVVVVYRFECLGRSVGTVTVTSHGWSGVKRREPSTGRPRRRRHRLERVRQPGPDARSRSAPLIVSSETSVRTALSGATAQPAYVAVSVATQWTFLCWITLQGHLSFCRPAHSRQLGRVGPVGPLLPGVPDRGSGRTRQPQGTICAICRNDAFLWPQITACMLGPIPYLSRPTQTSTATRLRKTRSAGQATDTHRIYANDECRIRENDTDDAETR
jgi:hypothetical protein